LGGNIFRRPLLKSAIITGIFECASLKSNFRILNAGISLFRGTNTLLRGADGDAENRSFRESGGIQLSDAAVGASGE